MKWELNEASWLQKHEVKHLINLLSEKAKSSKLADLTMFTAISTLLGCGARNSELCNLRIENIFIDGSRSTIRIFEGKGGKTESVIISSKLKKILKQHIKTRGVTHGYLLVSAHGKPFTRQGLGKLVKRAFKLAGLPEKLSAHSCRHTFISNFYIASGFDLIATSQVARHSSVTTTQIYAHIINPDIEKAMEGLYK